jgi:hypothetical protein
MRTAPSISIASSFIPARADCESLLLGATYVVVGKDDLTARLRPPTSRSGEGEKAIIAVRASGNRATA